MWFGTLSDWNRQTIKPAYKAGFQIIGISVFQETFLYHAWWNLDIMCLQHLAYSKGITPYCKFLIIWSTIKRSQGNFTSCGNRHFSFTCSKRFCIHITHQNVIDQIHQLNRQTSFNYSKWAKNRLNQKSKNKIKRAVIHSHIKAKRSKKGSQQMYYNL